MADPKTPEELAAEIKRLARENDTLHSKNLSLTKELGEVKGAVAAEKGPDKGTAVCFQAIGEPFHRPATIASAGFTERVPQPGGGFGLHCLLEVGEPPWVQHEHPRTGEAYTPVHTFQRDRAYNPLGLPDTWHMPDECPHAGDAQKCPYDDKVTGGRRASPEAL